MMGLGYFFVFTAALLLSEIGEVRSQDPSSLALLISTLQQAPNVSPSFIFMLQQLLQSQLAAAGVAPVPTTPVPTTPNPNPLVSVCGSSGKTPAGRQRIVGGRPAGPDDWPWMAALMNRITDVFFCGGSLINPKYVLTAAHCAKGQKPGLIYVRLHEYDFSQPRDRLNASVSAIKVHEAYDPSTMVNDIALLRLANQVNADWNGKIMTICLPDPLNIETYAGSPSTVIGWGLTAEKGLVSSVLMEVSIPVWDNSDCAESYQQLTYQIPDSALCAAIKTNNTEEAKDSCQGDSGGPLMVYRNNKWVQVGLVSWGIGCARPGYPGVYTRISSYLDWIAANSTD